ncbi:MAG TPA: hydrolase [Bacteroidota bacterium]|nr:hydrolase [Bacteroidota bacterium]
MRRSAEDAFHEIKWCKDFEAYAKGKHLDVKKWYMWYTTCPKCAKKYGKNYVAIIGGLN